MTAPLSRESVEGAIAGLTHGGNMIAVTREFFTALCNSYLSTIDRGDAAVRGEAVAWRMRRKGSDARYSWHDMKIPRPDDLDDVWTVEYAYASPLATPVAAGGDGRVVSDAEVEAACIAYLNAQHKLNIPRLGITFLTWDNCGEPWRVNARKEMRAALQAAERTRNEVQEKPE